MSSGMLCSYNGLVIMGSCEFEVINGGVVSSFISSFLAIGRTIGVNQFKGFTIKITFTKRLG